MCNRQRLAFLGHAHVGRRHADLDDRAGQVPGEEGLFEHGGVADGLDAHVGAVAVGERADRLHRIGRRGVDGVGGTELAGELELAGVEVDPDAPADVIGDEPVWHDGTVVGWITSGGYAHHSALSLALGYIPSELVDAGGGFEIEIIGRRRPAVIRHEPVLDPQGLRMRA